MGKACPQCGKINSDNYIFCADCGARLPCTVIEKPASQVRYCTKCEAPLTEGFAFCASCGAAVCSCEPSDKPEDAPPLSDDSPDVLSEPLYYSPTTAPAPAKKSGHSGLLIGLVIAVAALSIFLIVIGGLLLFSLSASPEKEASAPASIPDSVSIPEPSSPAPAPKPDPDHPLINFNNIEYVRPDFDSLLEKISRAKALSEAGASSDELFPLLDDILNGLNSASTMYSLVDIKSSLDYLDKYYSDEASLVMNKISTLNIAFNSMISYVIESDLYYDDLVEHWGEDFTESCYAFSSNISEKVNALYIRERALLDEYETIIKETTVNLYGREWTSDQIWSVTDLEYSQYLELYDALAKSCNQKAGPLYLELLNLRMEIAKELGYESYTQYAYDCHGRDYSPEDATALQDAVKKYIAPLYPEIYEMSYRTDYQSLSSRSYDSKEMLPTIYSVIEKISPDISASFKYMLGGNLYDIEMRSEKLSGGFTAYLSDYKAPFLYDNWTGSWTSVTDFTHELGHYNSYYHREEFGWNIPDGTDIAEVDSQSLVLLSTKYFEEFFSSSADAARMETLLSSMYSLLSGCLEDEFQQTICSNPDMSLEEINALYYDLSVDYGLQDIFATSPYEWVFVSHTFQSPLYYISYASAMIPALEIWTISLDDYDHAVNLYQDIVLRNTYDGFRSVIKDVGLSDPFDSDIIESLAGSLYSYAKSLT